MMTSARLQMNKSHLYVMTSAPLQMEDRHLYLMMSAALKMKLLMNPLMSAALGSSLHLVRHSVYIRHEQPEEGHILNPNQMG